MYGIAGRLQVKRWCDRDGDRIVLKQTHRNGSDKVVGVIQLDGNAVVPQIPEMIGRAILEVEAQ